MAQVYAALLLLSVYFGIGLLSLPILHGLAEGLFWKYCDAGFYLGDSCQAAAIAVAAQGLLATVLVAIVTIGFTRKAARDGFVPSASVNPFEASPWLMLLLLSALTAVLVIHNLEHDPIGLGGQHIRLSESALISIENLTWPLLLQLTFWSHQIRWKGVLLAYLAAIVAISPFRNAIFSIFYFGALVPLGTTLMLGEFSSQKTRILSFAAITALLLITSLILVYQTSRRFESEQYEGGPAQSRITKIETALTSRTFTPFFQAAMVEHLARAMVPLPNFLATLEEKFRIGKKENLNEYIYALLYGGQGLGQATTLYYGESVANTRISPIFWQFAAPLALVLAYFLFRPVCDVGVLIGIALWRSSMGGLFDVVTALSLQLGFCLVLSYFRSYSQRPLAIAAHRT